MRISVIEWIESCTSRVVEKATVALSHFKLSWLSLPVSEMEQPPFTYFSVLSLVHITGDSNMFPWYGSLV